MRRFGWILPDVLIALGATVVAGVVGFGPIAEDVSSRTATRLKDEGRGWATVTIDGRDVTLAGTAPEPAERVLAVESADRVFGVRVVADATTVLPLASPYPFGLERTADGVKVVGAVPNEAMRAAILETISEALPGVRVEDDTTLARGAPAGLSARAGFAAAVIADVADGSVTWSGEAVSLSGDPRDFAGWQAIERRVAHDLPEGTKVAADTLRTPVPPHWSFSVMVAEGRLVFDGFMPDAATRDRVLAAARAAFPGGVLDRSVIAPGAAPGTDAAIDFSLDAMSKVIEGGAKVDPTGFTIAGRPKTWEAYRDLETRLHGGAIGGLTVAGDGLIPPIPVPYRLALTATRDGAAIEGFVPDVAARDALVAAARSGFGGKVEDRLEVAPGAPKGFVETLLALVPTLSRLSDLRFELAGGTADLKGTAPTAALGKQISDKVRALLPAGAVLKEAAVAVAPPPAQVDAPTCQADLAKVQSGEKIHFDSGAATLREESLRILDALVAASLECLSARVTVEGHTDSEGDAAVNQTLSEARARAVVDHLVAAGIAAGRLTAIGYGETRPIADDATEEGRRQNRRIEFRVE